MSHVQTPCSHITWQSSRTSINSIVTVVTPFADIVMQNMQDAKVVDNACLALSRIAEAFAHKPASLNQLCEHGLINNAVQLVGYSATLPETQNG